MIDFTKVTLVGNEERYVLQAMKEKSLAGDGYYTKQCENAISNLLNTEAPTLLTPSCTAALEMAAVLINISEGDEVIMPSYTFVSTANAFILHGAKVVFVDIEADTMNIDAKKIEQAITEKTKAIVPVHYAGVSCAMDEIMTLAQKYSLYVIEDSAQALMSSYKSTPVGTRGHLAAFSFHSTKNYTSGGEGGCLVINDQSFIERAHILREKGTNRRNFIQGTVDKYTWVDKGSSFLMSEIQAAFLLGQLEKAHEINRDRNKSWDLYSDELKKLAPQVEIPSYKNNIKHNAHMFHIKVENKEIRASLINYLKSKNIQSVFHYVPLHSSPAGMRYSTFIGQDIYTTIESERIVRLPLWFGISSSEQRYVVEQIKSFFEKNSHNCFHRQSNK